QQQKIKPKIEDIIVEFLEGDRQQNALEFVAYLRTNKLNPCYASYNAWWVNYKGKRLISLRVGCKESVRYGLSTGSWHIGHWLQGFNFPDNIDDELKQFIWENTLPCIHCQNCAPGHSGSILGKHFESICYLRIENPDANGLEHVKKLLECKKKVIL
ncbi:MAG: hypothetical protein FWC32_07595, partial [Firmicutes bacterium]|nr:hypothetical protein [Bacillota bacterium]